MTQNWILNKKFDFFWKNYSNAYNCEDTRDYLDNYLRITNASMQASLVAQVEASKALAKQILKHQTDNRKNLNTKNKIEFEISEDLIQFYEESQKFRREKSSKLSCQSGNIFECDLRNLISVNQCKVTCTNIFRLILKKFSTVCFLSFKENQEIQAPDVYASGEQGVLFESFQVVYRASTNILLFKVNLDVNQDDVTSNVPLERAGLKREEELKLLYGDRANAIHLAETTLQMKFDKNLDLYEPSYWPSFPLKIKFN